MSIPTPSFFKIRLVIFVVFFVLMLLIIGITKNVFAAYSDAICKKTIKEEQSISSTKGWCYNTIKNINGDFNFYDRKYIENSELQSAKIANIWIEPNGDVRASITQFTIICPGVNIPGSNGDITSEIDNYEINGCPKCVDEKDSLIEKCGGNNKVDWSTWDDTTCSGGKCKPDCSGEGKETYEEADARCAGLEKSIVYYDDETCRGICGCSEEIYKREKEKCKPYDLIGFSEILCNGQCGNCQDKQDEAKAECGSKFLLGWDCDPDGNLSVRCGEEPPETIVPDPGLDKPETPTPPDDKTPEPDKPENPNDPSDENLKDIKKELGKIIDQNNDRKDQLSSIDNNLDWIGGNSKIIADNTKIIGDALNDLDTGLSDFDSQNLSRIKKNTEDTANTLDDISTGEFNEVTEKDPYTSEESYDFSTRTSDFLNQMKSTGLFSIPNTISSSIPGGGSPKLTISTGETFGGDHFIDFSNFNYALSILKYLFMISAMVISIRIVTLKR